MYIYDISCLRVKFQKRVNNNKNILEAMPYVLLARKALFRILFSRVVIVMKMEKVSKTNNVKK